MSVKVSALIWKIPMASLDKLLLLRLADFADDDGGRIFPAVATVARDCGMSERGAQYILKKFIDKGLLLIVGNETGGRGRPRHYAIDLDRAEEMAGPEGDGERVQRVQEPCTLNGHDKDPQTPQRVQATTEKGAQALHPIHQGTVKEGGGGSAGARAPEVVVMVAGLTGLPATGRNVATVEAWLAAGYHPQLDIYPAVVEALPTAKRPVGHFAYFTGPVSRHHAERTAPPAVPGNVRYLPRAAGGRRMTADDAAACDLLSDLRASGYEQLLGVPR